MEKIESNLSHIQDAFNAYSEAKSQMEKSLNRLGLGVDTLDTCFGHVEKVVQTRGSLCELCVRMISDDEIGVFQGRVGAITWIAAKSAKKDDVLQVSYFDERMMAIGDSEFTNTAEGLAEFFSSVKPESVIIRAGERIKQAVLESDNQKEILDLLAPQSKLKTGKASPRFGATPI